MSEEILIDDVNVAECHNKTPYKNDYGDVQCKCYRFEDIENDTFLFGICKQHPNCYYKQLKRLQAELQKYKDMEAKGLEEFKDIGGCWGCGLQLQLDQDLKDIKRLRAENEEKDKLLKWLITQQYYILPKNLKQRINEVIKRLESEVNE